MSHLNSSLKEFENYFKNKGVELKGKILDVGCRDHTTKAYFNVLGLEWEGIDKSPQQTQGNIISMNMEELNFEDDYYDFLFVCHSLEHCENPLQALKEFHRVLKKGGYVFISLPCHCAHHILESDADHIFCFTDIQLMRLMGHVGFTNEVFKGTQGGWGEGSDRGHLTYYRC